jgi:ketosteroid isomerase-like protein
MMTPADFLREYEQKINTHRFDHVAPLIAEDAIFWFNDGSFGGLDQIRAAFEKTWNLIREERYAVEDVQWIAVGQEVAVCIYVFRWEGLIDGRPQWGTGRGTSVLRKEDERWVVAHEHLSPMPA